MKRVLILGIGGQDGSFLAELLLEKGYSVHGLYRRSSSDNLWRVRHVLDKLTLHQGDLADPQSIDRAIDAACPHEVYALADQDHVGWSHATPAYSMDITAGAVVRLLESVRRFQSDTPQFVKVFQPVSATMFGDKAAAPQNERTGFAPASPYAIAKTAAFLACQHYRRDHGLFVSTGILFNHDSPRRGHDYLLQRIARGIPLTGSLDTIVDIGFAGDFMEAAWRMMQLDQSTDLVIGTGRGYRITDLVAGAKDGRPPHPVVNPTTGLVADYRKAKALLDFVPDHDAWSTLEMIREAIACA